MFPSPPDSPSQGGCTQRRSQEAAQDIVDIAHPGGDQKLAGLDGEVKEASQAEGAEQRPSFAPPVLAIAVAQQETEGQRIEGISEEVYPQEARRAR